MKALVQTETEVHAALCDNFNTPETIKLLSDLIHKVHVYLKELGDKKPKAFLIRSIAVYVTKILKVYGLIDSDIGYTTSDIQAEAILTPVLNALTQFRTDVRNAARAKDTSKLLDLCDQIRDDVLPPLGIRLADTTTGSFWTLEDKEIIMKDVQLKRETERKKQEEKEAKKKAELERSKIPPEKLFIDQKDKFSQFDDKGIPTHDQEAKPLSKKARANAEKEWSKQQKEHEKYLQSLQNNNN